MRTRLAYPPKSHTIPNMRGTPPHLTCSCSGAYDDWLDVFLTERCNGKCSWCIERDGWLPDPRKRVGWEILFKRIVESRKKKVLLLGGEPTLYTNLRELIADLKYVGITVWLTTNGSLLTADFVEKHLVGLTGINISIHHFDLQKNREITGVKIIGPVLADATEELYHRGIHVCFNCNLIKNQIDTFAKMRDYVALAKIFRANKVKFSELKFADDQFVDLYALCGKEFRKLNEDPYKYGCYSTHTIRGLPVVFKQACGLVTAHRPCPDNPDNVAPSVMYYDGVIYEGWQTKRSPNMDATILAELLEKVHDHKMSVAEAAILIDRGANLIDRGANKPRRGCSGPPERITECPPVTYPEHGKCH